MQLTLSPDLRNPTFRKAFLDLPYRLHAKDPAWVPPFRAAVRAQLSPNAAFTRHGEWVHVLATSGGKPVARCTAMINSHYVDELPDGQKLGFIGYFEAVNDYEATHAVLSEAMAWLRERGVTTVRGPINTSTYFPYRFMTEGFEHAAFFLEPYNPPHYPEHWRRFGFRERYGYASAIVDSADFARQTAPHHARAMAAGYHARIFDLKRFDDELRLMYDLSTAIFKGSWMWRPVSFEDFRLLYAGMRGILDPDLCYFLFHGHTPVGFVFGLPDVAPAVRAMRGSQSLFAKLRFLSKRHQTPAALLKTFGVLPAHRNGSLALSLCHLMHDAAARKGYARTVHALMREDNTSLRMSHRFGGSVFKRYAIFEIEA